MNFEEVNQRKKRGLMKKDMVKDSVVWLDINQKV
jgi:hypothetical protein